MRVQSTFLFFLCFSFLQAKAQFSENFNSCDRNALIGCCWSFCGVDVNSITPMQGGACNARSATLVSANSGATYMQLPAVAVFAANAKLSFRHCMTNLSSAPSLVITAINLTTNVQHTVQVYNSSFYSSNNVHTTEINWPLGIGVFKVFFRGTGNGGSSRFVVDNILFTNARQVASPALNCALVLSQPTVKNFAVSNVAGSYIAKWRTDAANFTKYEVEASTDRSNFVKLAQTMAQGNPSADYQVSVVNQQLARYFRLKMYRSDGSYEYSAIISIELPNDLVVSLYPNPTTNGWVQVRTKQQVKGYQIWNSMGSMVKGLTQQSQNFSIDISDLAKGLYQVRIIMPSGEVTTRNLIIQ